ncbi:transcriptional regulator, Cro/CI family [hydrothermal vent metagenome]|uniref:Transcriptional regulator, Cro/CI family n=1 Tax=hydrothermal vent metagenome TaxID=652676 RepID=A0A3B0VFN2_9ZZZZ
MEPFGRQRFAANRKIRQQWGEILATLDELIGLKIKTIRKGSGMSQIELAEKLGLSFQQVQKYEKGVTRISVLRLQQISEALGVPMAVFFAKADRTLQVAGPVTAYGGEEEEIQAPFDREGMILLKLFRRIKNRRIREGLLKQLRGIIELQGEQ